MGLETYLMIFLKKLGIDAINKRLLYENPTKPD